SLRFLVNGVNKAVFFELSNQTRIDNILRRELRHLGIKFRKKVDQGVDALVGGIRFANIQCVASQRLVYIVDLRRIVELEIFPQDPLHFRAVSLLRDESDSLDDASHGLQRRVTMLCQIGFAAIQRLMLVRDAESSEIPEVLVSFFEHERYEGGIHHGSIDGSTPEPG